MRKRSWFARAVALGALGLNACGGDTNQDAPGGAGGGPSFPAASAGLGGSTPAGGPGAEPEEGSEHAGGTAQAGSKPTPGGAGSGTDTALGGAGEAGGAAGNGAARSGAGGDAATGGSGPVSRVCTLAASALGVTVLGECDPASGVSVAVGEAPAALEGSVVPASPVVTIGNVAERRVSLRITPDAGVPADELLAVRILPDGSIAPLAHDPDGTSAIVEVDADGSYAIVRVAPAPLPNCGTELVSGNRSASANSELGALEGVSFLAGSLSLLGGVTDLSRLSCLRSIGGDLVIGDTTALVDTAGLSNLVRIGGKLTVSANSGLASLALPSLLLLNGVLTLTGNAALGGVAIDRVPQLAAAVDVLRNGASATSGTSVSLRNLQSVRASIHIDDNAGLTSLDFGALARLTGGVHVSENDRLTRADFGRLRVTGFAQFMSNETLASIDLGGLVSLDGPLTITGNRALAELDVSRLAEVTDTLQLESNGATAQSATVFDFGALGRVTGDFFWLNSNPKLASLSGFSALEQIGATFEIHANAALTDLGGLAAVEAIDSLYVEDNAALTSIELGVTSLGYTRIRGNAALTTVRFRELEEASSYLILYQNGTNAAGTTTFDFPKLRTIGEEFTIYGNPGLTNLDGFGALTTIGSSFFLSQNPALTNTNGLAKLARIENYLFVYNNDALTSLALDSLTYLWNDLLIVDNGQLPNCVATALRDRLPAAAEGRVRQANLTANLADACPEDPAPPALF